MVHEVRPPDAEVENIDLLQDGVVKGIKEPGSVGHLVEPEHTCYTSHGGARRLLAWRRETEGGYYEKSTRTQNPMFPILEMHKVVVEIMKTCHVMSNDTE